MGTLTLGDIRSQIKLALGNREDLDEHINSLINTCQMRLARFFDFEEMISTGDLAVAYSADSLADASISLPTYTRDVHSISIIDGTSYYSVQAVDRRTWKTKYYNAIVSSTTSRPTQYCVFANIIEIFPAPDQAYTAKLRRSTWPIDLTTDESKSELSQKDDLLIALTICWTLFHLNNTERANAYWAIFKSMVKEAVDSQTVKPDLYQKLDTMSPIQSQYWKDPFVRNLTYGS
jgi:hypothetical protein|tara:strand:+ start:2827 stop:3525 length:699 start_codon:yes stop_codon:yes gene_type:complete